MRWFVLPGLLLPFVLFVSPALAADKEPVMVRGDRVEYFDNLRKVVATGRVEATYRNVKLTCDSAVIYMETKDAYLKGRVRLMQLEGLMSGEEVLYNFQTKKGTVLLAEGQAGGYWRTKADQAEKVAADSYLERSGYLTSCDFEEPHTRLRAREIQVFMDDKVVLKDVLMYLGSAPLFYLPSYTHLLDDKRPRVTLIPGKDKNWGYFLLTSWRVYWNENAQGQFHVDYREKLDLATGLDLKYKLPAGGEGLFREYYTNERSLHRKHFYSRWTSPAKDHPTTERERFRVQVRHTWEVDDSTKATLEFNRMKDPTLIKDFFERESEQGGVNPASYFQLIHTSSWYGLTFLANKRVNPFDTVTEQLPFVSFNLRPLEVPWLPKVGRSGLYYQSSYSYEHSDSFPAHGGRENALETFNTLQELFYPTKLVHWLNFRPFFRFRQTSFSRGKTDGSPQFRQAAATGFDLSGKVFRVYPLETDFLGLNLHHLRHVMTPTLLYEYQANPTISADKLLRSDGLAKSNRLTPGIEHKVQTKRMQNGSQRAVDLGRFTTQMPYDLEGSGGRGGEWNNLSMDAELLPYPWLRLESDAAVDPHIGKFETINADWVLHPKAESGWGGRRISEFVNTETGELKDLPWAVGLGWRYQREKSAQATFEAEFNLGQKWRVGVYQAVDVKRFVQETGTFGTRTVKKIYDVPESEYRLERDLHEWTGSLVYNISRGHGDSILILFRLKAAPELPAEFRRGYHQPKAGRNFPKTK